MKKRTGKLALALAAFAMLVTTFGCKDPNNGIKTVEEETKSYTVTFNTNGGSAIEAVSVDEGNTLTLPDDPTKTGYDFKGWFTDDALSAEFDATVAITEDTTLYAKWAATSYTITYVLNDEKATNAAANPATYTIESEDITLADPTTENTEKPHFAGWYSDETCETAATGITKGSTGNKTFYAKWSDKLQYTVTFYNGETSLGKVKVTEGEKVTIPSTIAVEGYTIEGWYTDSALTKTFAADTVISADTALYAKKSVIKYTITYNLDGGTNAEANPDEYTVETAAITLADPTKSGYTFAGWYKESAFTTKVTEIAKGSTGNVTLYANWVANVVKHTVTFYDGTTVLSTASVEDGKTVTKPTDPTKDGYVFFGWYSDDAFETEFAFTSAIKADTKVYAKLIEKMKTVLELDESYTGAIPYTYGSKASGEGWQNVSGSDYYLNIKKASLVENGTIKISFKFYEISNIATSVAVQGAFDKWTSFQAVYDTSDGKQVAVQIPITAEGLASIGDDNSYAAFKIVPQYGKEDCGDYSGKSFNMLIENLKVVYTEPLAEGADLELVAGEIISWTSIISADKIDGYASTYDTLEITLRNDATESRKGWGVMYIIAQEMETWGSQKLAVTGTDDTYTSLAVTTSFDSGEEGKITVDFKELYSLFNEYKTNGGYPSVQLCLQPDNGAVITSALLKKTK